jgi:hypothetical protein
MRTWKTLHIYSVIPYTKRTSGAGFINAFLSTECLVKHGGGGGRRRRRRKKRNNFCQIL